MLLWFGCSINFDLSLFWFGGDISTTVVYGFSISPAACCVEAEAVKAINLCLSGLYRSGVFIPSDQAAQIADQGLTFLRLYAEMARMAYSRGQRRFPLVPKGHYLHHTFLSLWYEAQGHQWCTSPLIYAVQMQEDYIGKPSRLARRVSSKTTSLRVLQRSFLAIRNALGWGADA